MLNKFIFSCLFTVCFMVSAYAQSGRIVKKHSVQDGLSQGVITSITQDSQGLMWFGTEDGLNRFDGYSFKVFKYGEANENGLTDNYVQRVFSDSEGSIWSSSRSGLYYFDQSREQFVLYRHPFPSFNNDITDIIEGSQKKLWIAWYVNGFASFDKATKQFTPYTTTTVPDLTTNSSITVYEDSYGLLWIGSQNLGLNVYQIKKGGALVKRADLSDRKILPSFYIKCVEEDHLGNLWIGSTKGLVVYLRQENRFYSFNDPACRVKNKGIFSLLEDHNHHLWIGTQGEGVYKINLQNFNHRQVGQLSFEPIKVLDQYNISQHTIRSLYEDKDKNIWIGTHGDGIYMIGSVDKNFINIRHKQYVKAAESFVQCYGLCYDGDGHLWLGSDGYGIYRTDVMGDLIRHYTADGAPGSITDNAVLTAFKDHADNLWFGTYAHGLFLYDRGTGTFRNFSHAKSDSTGHMGNQVRLIYEDSKNHLWVGASRGGLCRIDKKEGVFKNFAAQGLMKYADVRAMAEDKEGGIWIGCYGDGLYYFQPQTGSYKRYFAEPGDAGYLKSNVVFALAIDRKDRVWIGTGGSGLSVYDPIKNTLQRFTEKNGLINNTVYAIQIDAAGKIWVSTNKGIAKFDPETEHFTNYNTFDGLQEGQFNPGSSFQNHAEGYIGFGGSQGLTIFYPGKITENSLKPSVMISGFQLFNKPVGVGDETQVLDKAISNADNIVLKHDQSVFTIEFVALDYSFPEKNKYAYKMEGLDGDWNYVGTQRAATYRYLGPGEYTFKVKASHQDNVWPDGYAALTIIIRPPFWKTWWAYLMYLGAITAAIYGVLAVRRKQAALSRRLKIERAQRKRERHLVQQRLSFFTEVSHEFRTPLTLIIGPLEDMLMREGGSPTGKRLKMVHRNAIKLLNLINMLLDYRKIESGNMVLKVKEDDMVGFVEEIFVTFKALAMRKHIHFHLHASKPAIAVWFDREKMEMVLNNVLSNSFKYIGNGNEISVSVKTVMQDETAGRVSLEIRDNGIGIPRDQLKHIFDWFYQGNSASPMSSGIGLALAKKLVYLHRGEILVQSSAGGTVFTINLPLGKAHLLGHTDVIIDAAPSKTSLAEVPFDDEDEKVAEADHTHRKGLKSILIVEDDEEILTFLKDYLQPSYKILEAQNGREAWEIATEQHTDLIVSDVMMPEMDGIAFCKQLRNNIRTSHIPIILLTARTSLIHHKEGLEMGADAYLTKPFSPEILAITINNLFQSQENLKRFYRGLFTPSSAEKKEIISADEKFLQKVYEHLKSNLDKPEFDLNDLADALAMSRSLLYKKIKMLTGQSPIEYLRSIRLQEAAHLLRSKKYKVFEVVYMVGFNDLKYFRQCFVKEFGYPPSELLEK